jgi:prevent-host-death family protein
MLATIVDLRYKMKEVLKALDRKEPVTIVYHGKEKCVIIPSAARRGNYTKSADHPFFGSARSDGHDVAAEMEKLRSGRHICRGGSRTALAGKTREAGKL